ncbi:MAG: hypothetical protein COU51_03850 [Parcubacteria group bacterium CG10_big_fil_rev_8_21_14_0_10_36_14]|nr:MAG: hypothetical protein COU51_03850 [Parcubacteria group bacterium CG10_big_fil_rev_8_21_14_0_10_36_14]
MKEKPIIYSGQTSEVSGEIKTTNKKLLERKEEDTVIIEKDKIAEKGRPTEDEIQEKVGLMRTKKEVDPKYFESTEDDLESLSQGRDSSGIGKEFYPGWKPEDFKKLLELIK